MRGANAWDRLVGYRRDLRTVGNDAYCLFIIVKIVYFYSSVDRNASLRGIVYIGRFVRQRVIIELPL